MLRIGTVGTSAIMRVIQEGIRLTEGMECRTVYSRSAERGRAFADSVGVAETCSDYEALVRRDDLDVIYLASPNCFHAAQAQRALEHGKHVIIEKPAAVTAAEVQRLTETAQIHDVFFFEAITTLFMPKYRACRALLPELGRIHTAKLCYAQRSSKYDAYLRGENPNIFNPAMQAGALNDMGVYCVHVAVDLFGVPERVHYEPELGPNGIDLAGRLTLTYPSLTCEILTAKHADFGSGCRIEGANGYFAETGPMNEFGCCTAVLNGAEVSVDVSHAENRMVYELARFRDAILARDTAFFDKMARQSLAVSAILEKAHD